MSPVEEELFPMEEEGKQEYDGDVYKKREQELYASLWLNILNSLTKRLLQSY